MVALLSLINLHSTDGFAGFDWTEAFLEGGHMTGSSYTKSISPEPALELTPEHEALLKTVVTHIVEDMMVDGMMVDGKSRTDLPRDLDTYLQNLFQGVSEDRLKSVLKQKEPEDAPIKRFDVHILSHVNRFLKDLKPYDRALTEGVISPDLGQRVFEILYHAPEVFPGELSNNHAHLILRACFKLSPSDIRTHTLAIGDRSNSPLLRDADLKKRLMPLFMSQPIDFLDALSASALPRITQGMHSAIIMGIFEKCVGLTRQEITERSKATLTYMDRLVSEHMHDIDKMQIILACLKLSPQELDERSQAILDHKTDEDGSSKLLIDFRGPTIRIPENVEGDHANAITSYLTLNPSQISAVVDNAEVLIGTCSTIFELQDRIRNCKTLTPKQIQAYASQVSNEVSAES